MTAIIIVLKFLNKMSTKHLCKFRTTLTKPLGVWTSHKCHYTFKMTRTTTQNIPRVSISINNKTVQICKLVSQEVWLTIYIQVPSVKHFKATL